jgi:hypothetical protein
LCIIRESNTGLVDGNDEFSTRPMMLEDQANLRADSLVICGESRL